MDMLDICLMGALATHVYLNSQVCISLLELLQAELHLNPRLGLHKPLGYNLAILVHDGQACLVNPLRAIITDVLGNLEGVIATEDAASHTP